MAHNLDIVILGLSITSSWGNGHATTYRALTRALSERGHRVLFLERDRPWYAAHRDLSDCDCACLYSSLDELRDKFALDVEGADLVIIGSYVPEGIAVGEWVQQCARGVTAFYDIDTPVTLARLKQDDCDYLHPRLIPGYDLYLSFTGGPLLLWLERYGGAPLARALYCAVDPELYHPDEREPEVDLGYMGTYSEDRQPLLERLLLQPAQLWSEGGFVVAGPQYPAELVWPDNVERIEHLPPSAHRSFYTGQRFTLNLTRASMVEIGYSPSVRLFEAAACATPIISDFWSGLDTLFQLGREILIANSPKDVLVYLRVLPEEKARRLGRRARERVLAEHTAMHRAVELEGYFEEAVRRRRRV